MTITRPQSASKLLVAVDFGTTFSGVAWSQTIRPENQNVVIQWPDRFGSLDGVTQDKVPTEIAYNGNVCKWGFQIKDGEGRHQWFKMGLDEEQAQQVSQLSLQYPDPHALPPSYSQTSIDISVDFLKALKIHTEAILKSKLGNGVMSTTPIEYIITVPAIWSDAAKNRTRSCARRAGMGRNVRIISEPEAAALPLHPESHDYSRSWFDEFDGYRRIDVADWLVEKGDNIDETVPIISKFFTEQLVSEGRILRHAVNIYACADEHDIGAPFYIDDPGVKQLARLEADLSSIPTTQVDIEKGANGQRYYVLHYEIHVNLFSAHTEYSLWFKGKRYGSVQAEYV